MIINREYLFRAKSVITKTFKQRVWVYGLFHKVCDKYYMFGYLDVDACDMSDEERQLKKIFPRVYEVELETICQFVDVYANGQIKLFTGDIIEDAKNRGNKYTIEYKELSFRLNPEHITQSLYNLYCKGRIKLVGNIYDADF